MRRPPAPAFPERRRLLKLLGEPAERGSIERRRTLRARSDSALTLREVRRAGCRLLKISGTRVDGTRSIDVLAACLKLSLASQCPGVRPGLSGRQATVDLLGQLQRRALANLRVGPTHRPGRARPTHGPRSSDDHAYRVIARAGGPSREPGPAVTSAGRIHTAPPERPLGHAERAWFPRRVLNAR